MDAMLDVVTRGKPLGGRLKSIDTATLATSASSTIFDCRAIESGPIVIPNDCLDGLPARKMTLVVMVLFENIVTKLCGYPNSGIPGSRVGDGDQSAIVAVDRKALVETTA